MDNAAPIGVFDSGYGGLTILSKIQKVLPTYDFIYLGDNSRAPYGSRSFDIVYEFTLQAVKKLFAMGCNLVILACNTASAKALRTIQQNDLPLLDPTKRVLGIIIPTAEIIDEITRSKHIGILGTEGTILSKSYELEINKLYPNIKVNTHACPMWVPLVENHEFDKEGADYYIEKDLNQLLQKDQEIDTIILACTHYPLLYNKIRNFTPDRVKLLSQGEYVAMSLKNYLKRHPEMDHKCSKNSITKFYTTENSSKFKDKASYFLNRKISAVERISLDEL